MTVAQKQRQDGVRCCVALCCVVLCCVVLWCVVLCCVVLCCVVLCCVVLCCVVLCCVVLSLRSWIRMPHLPATWRNINQSLLTHTSTWCVSRMWLCVQVTYRIKNVNCASSVPQKSLKLLDVWLHLGYLTHLHAACCCEPLSVTASLSSWTIIRVFKTWHRCHIIGLLILSMQVIT